MVTTFPGLDDIYKSCIWSVPYAYPNKLSAFLFFWVIQRQHRQYTIIQMMFLPVLFPCSSSPHFLSGICFHHSIVALSVLSICLYGSMLTTAVLGHSKCQMHLAIMQAECLVSALKGEPNQNNLNMIVTTSQNGWVRRKSPILLCVKV